MQQQQRIIQMQRTVVPNRMMGVSQQILQPGTAQQTRQLAPPPPYPGPPPPYPGQHQVKYELYCIIYNFYSVINSSLKILYNFFNGFSYFAIRYFFCRFPKKSMLFK